MSRALAVGLLAATLGCSDVVGESEPEPEGPFAITVRVSTVLHEGQSWEERPASILYPSSGVGADDGNEVIPASALAESGLYELRVHRGLQGLGDQDIDGHRVSVSNRLQINLERTLP